MAPIPPSLSTEKQWAQVFSAQGSELQYMQIEKPRIAPDEILVQLKFSGVCHTDYHVWKGDWPAANDQTLVGGHEGTGLVAEVGENVHDLNIGDRVGVQWINRTCGDCDFCHDQEEPLCPNIENSGYTVNGTFQQFCVCKGDNAVKIPADIPLEMAAPILCAGVTVYNALKEANLKPGQTVAIVGAGGGLGSLACQYAKACGYNVLALSSGQEKKKLCENQLGVDYFVDYKTTPDVIYTVKSLTNGGPQAAIVVAAVEEPFRAAVEYVRSGGCVVAVGLPPGLACFDLFSAVSRKITIKGSYVGNKLDTEEALRIFRSFMSSYQYRKFHLVDLPKIFDLMSKGEMQGRAVLEIPDIRREKSMIPKFSQAQYNLGTALAYRLEELGVKDYFVVPGDFNLTLLDQLLKNQEIRMVGCCNELNAGYAADGYARSSPAKVAVVVVTFMVGGLSLINAIAGAFSDRQKVIVISGCPNSTTFGQDIVIHHSLGTADRDQTIRMFKEVTAASVRLTGKQDPVQVLDQAFTSCLEKSLPVYIEIPADLAEVPCATPEPLLLPKPRPAPGALVTHAVSRIMNAWNSAQRPVVIIGSLVRNQLDSSLVVDLVDKLGCAVFCQPDGKSLLPESRRILDLRNEYIGIPLAEAIQGLPLMDVVKTLMEVDIPSKPDTADELSRCACHVMTNGCSIDLSPLPVHSVLKGIESILTPRDTLIAETGDSWFNAQKVRLPDGADYQMQMMYGSIGWSLPATLGSQLARPGGRTILMIGDGSFQMTCQELSTMIRMGVNPVIFIFNNLGYAIETAIHEGPYNYISNWNYTTFSSSMSSLSHSRDGKNPFLTRENRASEIKPSMFAMQIKTSDELSVAMDRILCEPEKMAVIECCIQPKDISDQLRRFGDAVGKKHDLPVQI